MRGDGRRMKAGYAKKKIFPSLDQSAWLPGLFRSLVRPFRNP